MHFAAVHEVQARGEPFLAQNDLIWVVSFEFHANHSHCNILPPRAAAAAVAQRRNFLSDDETPWHVDAFYYHHWHSSLQYQLWMVCCPRTRPWRWCGGECDECGGLLMWVPQLRQHWQKHSHGEEHALATRKW